MGVLEGTSVTGGISVAEASGDMVAVTPVAVGWIGEGRTVEVDLVELPHAPVIKRRKI
jgi:hypothetical protein